MMKKLSLMCFLTVFALAAVFGGGIAPAQTTSDARKGEVAKLDYDVAVSISSLGDVKAAIGTVAEKVNPLAGMLLPLLNQALPPEIAAKGSIGMVGNIDPTAPPPGDFKFFLPVKTKDFDEDAFSQKILENFDQLEGITMKYADGWALFSPKNDKTKASKDLEKLLDTLPGRYLFAAQVKPATLAPLLAVVGDNEMMPVDTGVLAESLKQVDALLFGLNLEKSGNLSMDVVMQPVPGSDEADKLAKSVAVKSKLVGFYDPNAAIAMQGAGYLPEESVEAVREQMEGGEDTPPVVTLFAGQILGAKRVDAAVSVYEMSLEVGPSPAVMAFAIEDGPTLKKELQKLAKEYEGDDDYSFRFDVDTVTDPAKMNVHVFTTPDFGEVAMVISKTYVFLAMNMDDNVATLKKLVSSTLKAAAPKTQYQAHFHADKLGMPGMEGSVYVKGYFTNENTLVNLTVEAKLISSIIPLLMSMGDMFGGGGIPGMGGGMMPPGGMPPGGMSPGNMPMKMPPQGM